MSRYTVTRWARVWRESGVADLQKRKADGRLARLDKEGQGQLLEALRKGAKAYGFADKRWTLPRIAEVLNK